MPSQFGVEVASQGWYQDDFLGESILLCCAGEVGEKKYIDVCNKFDPHYLINITQCFE